MKRMIRQLAILVIVLAMLLPAGAAFGETFTVAYVNAQGVAQTPAACTLVTDTALSGGWYAVQGSIDFSECMTVSGEVNLILCDNSVLTANNGIRVPEGSSLTIWAQSTGNNMGRIVAKRAGSGAGIGAAYQSKSGEIIINGGHVEAAGGYNGAGIGGSYESRVYSITINGGHIEATGGEHGAGIGGGGGGGDINDHGSITVNGGDVTAIAGRNGAGIGSGDGDDNWMLTITGGTVHASGYNAGAGIGGGRHGDCGTITISGGTVYADVKNDGSIVEGAADDGPGIGAGGRTDCTGNITIRNAVVTATGGDHGAGIGAGNGGPESGDLESTITIENSTVTARGGSYKNRNGAAGIGAGQSGNASEGTINIINSRVSAYGGYGAAGIGGGRERSGVGGEGATVNISGRNTVIIAQSGVGWCWAVGHGDNDRYSGHITFTDGLMVNAGDDEDHIERTFTAAEREAACQYRHYARIEACNHPNASCVSVTASGHLQATCQYCAQVFMEQPHVWDDATHKCTVCGYVYGGELVNIRFDGNGGSGEMAPLTYMPEGIYTPPECGFTPPEGLRFRGWLVETEGTGAEDPASGIHFPGEPFILPGGGDVVLKAYWVSDALITFDPAEGTGEMAAVRSYTGEQYPLPGPEAFTEPEWHHFAGWQVNNDTQNLRQPLEKITIEGDTIVRAVWQRRTHTVTLDPGNGVDPTDVPVLNGETLGQPSDPIWEGHEFLGWYGDNEAYDFSVPVTDSFTLTAAWKYPWAILQETIENAADGAVITLSADTEARAEDMAVVIPAGKSVTLDLNGHTLSRARTGREDNGWVITVNGELTIRGSGTITGGWSNGSCGGVYVSGRLILNGGSITGNTADNTEHTANGGGVYIAPGGIFDMNDGSISGNTAGYGGGVYAGGAAFTMTGGSISGNTAGYGGGAYVRDNAEFYMTGGGITGNNARFQCGGVDFYNGTLRISGSPVIRDNTSGGSLPENVYVSEGKTIQVAGALTPNALLGITMETPGVFTSGLPENGIRQNFASDSSAFLVGSAEGGEACLFDYTVFGSPDFTLPGGISVIEEYAFEGIAASVVYIPDGCQEIGVYAFRNCPNLMQIRIPSGCAIGEFAFDGCGHVYIFGTAGSGAEQYCRYHDNCEFTAE